MDEEERREIGRAIREAAKKSRGYASYFDWRLDRDLEEWGVAQCVRGSREAQGLPFYYSHLRVRGRSNDPPDCEACDAASRRVAVEITELVSEDATKAYQAGRIYDFGVWDRATFLSELSERITRKDKNFYRLKDAPYDGGYELIVFTDEPMLGRETVEGYLSGHVFDRTAHLSRVLLLLGYDPGIQRCPLYELDVHA